MKYLFFDTESSNCINGVHKICEFGYILTDEKFTVISRDDYLINPTKKRDCRFRLTGRKNQVDCILGHPYGDYYDSPEFDFFYHDFVNLFSQKDLLVFGFSLDNDLVALIQACYRYKLPNIECQGYDVQLFLSKYRDGSLRKRNLSSAVESLYPPEELLGIRPHRPDDDSKMTMMVLRKICESLSLSPLDLITLVPEAAMSSTELAREIDSDGHILAKAAVKAGFTNQKFFLKYNDEYNSFFDDGSPIVEGPLSGQHFSVSGEFRNHPEISLGLLQAIKGAGGIITRNILGSRVVCFDENDIERLKSIITVQGLSFITLEDLKKIL